ncbi:hypothetical protein SRABI106_03806 [Rahnella aquatilis]|nr:hypothetical protein SRABI106_03806 [Rahnella aquatilis]
MVIANGFCCIERFPAANTHHAFAPFLLQNRAKAIDFRMAAFAVKAFCMAAYAVFMQTIQYLVTRQFHDEIIGNHKKTVRQVFGILTEQRCCIWTLKIFCRRLNNL